VRDTRTSRKKQTGAQTCFKTKFWFEKITNQVSDQILVLKQVSRKKNHRGKTAELCQKRVNENERYDAQESSEEDPIVAEGDDDEAADVRSALIISRPFRKSRGFW